MAISLNDELLPLKDAPSVLPWRSHHSTVWRWVTCGVRGIRLETISIGSRRFTSRSRSNRSAMNSRATRHSRRRPQKSPMPRSRTRSIARVSDRRGPADDDRFRLCSTVHITRLARRAHSPRLEESRIDDWQLLRLTVDRSSSRRTWRPLSKYRRSHEAANAMGGRPVSTTPRDTPPASCRASWRLRDPPAPAARERAGYSIGRRRAARQTEGIDTSI